MERYSVHTRAVLTRSPRTSARDIAIGEEYFWKLFELLRESETLADQADEGMQIRILADVCREMYPLLAATHPQTGSPNLRCDTESYRKDIEHYFNLSERVVESCERLKLSGLAKQYRTAFNVDALLESLTEAPKLEAPTVRSVTVNFDSADEPCNWLSDGTQKRLISPVEMTDLTAPSGEKLPGVRIKAPLSELPVIPHGNINIHAGRFYAERVFKDPVKVEGCHFVDLHLHASSDVPVTIYMNDLHSDFLLHAGEQIVRIDLRNFAISDQFDWRKWSQIHRLSIDIWPHDNYYPYPQTKDVKITLLSLKASNHKPTAALLPHKGKVIWLSQFRANIPHQIAVPEELFDKFMQRQKYSHPGLDHGSKYLHEGFRTFTEHRAVSPIFAILTIGADEVEQKVAQGLQHYLAEMFGVYLPIDPTGLRSETNMGNAIFVGKEACLASGWVQQKELDYVGAGGFVVHAWQGRIALAGADVKGTSAAAGRYLEDYFARFYAPGMVQTPDLKADLLHELYVLDQPWFADRPQWEQSWFETNAEAADLPTERDIERARQIAEAIKNLARSGMREVPPEILKEGERTGSSILSRYIVNHLLRNPFADVTRMIREFPKKNVN
jgi:hypothetical protein